MVFEVRDGVPPVSTGLTRCRDLFLRGEVRGAWAVIPSEMLAVCKTTTDFQLWIEMARACGARRSSFAVARLAYRRFPADVPLRLYHALGVSGRGRSWPALRMLEESEPPSVDRERAHWDAELAWLRADAGCHASSRATLQRIADSAYSTSGPVLYARAFAHHAMGEWDDALRLAAACVEASPAWMRARVLHIDCLVSGGCVDEAVASAEEARRLRLEDAMLDLTASMLVFSQGQFDRAEELFLALLRDWPRADFVGWVRRTLCILLMELGRPAEAADVVEDDETCLDLPPLPMCASGAHQFVPVPLLAQRPNECLPTAVAMALWPRGYKLDPGRLFRDMQGRAGVELWRVREWGAVHGFRAIPTELTTEAIRSLLDANIPLIGLLEHPFGSHAELICGYREDLDVVYVRDPGAWAPFVIRQEAALMRYALHGGLIAVVPDDDTEALSRARSFESADCAALIDLTEAVAKGDRLQAEAAHERIADDSPASFLRDACCRAVVLSPRRFLERMADLANQADGHPVARFRALLTLDLERARDAAQHMGEDAAAGLGDTGRRYLLLLATLERGDLLVARRLVDQLLLVLGSLGFAWALKGDVLAELGDSVGSERALQRAIELEPFRMEYRQKALERRSNALTFAEYLAEFDELLSLGPDDKSLLWGRALALSDGPDGLAFESAARGHLTWFPRDPLAWGALWRWYRFQRRDDLAGQVRSEAQDLLPNEMTAFMPTEDSQAGDASAAALPTTIDGLLDIGWNGDDPRQSLALQRLGDLERERSLGWAERARFLACRLYPSANQLSLTAAEVDTLLPDAPPGAPHWFVTVVTDLVISRGVSPELARSLVCWVERAVPQFRHYIALWLNRTMLIAAALDMERAVAELTALLARYPGSSAALFQVGCLKSEQRDFRDSISTLQRAIEVNPGLPGAIVALRHAYAATGDAEGVLACVRRLRGKYPHDVRLLSDEALALAEDSSDAARELVAQARDALPMVRVTLIEALLDLRDGALEEANRRLAGLVGQVGGDDELFEDWLNLRLEVALAGEDHEEILAVCDEGQARWPESSHLKEARGSVLSSTDPAAAAELFADVLLHGVPTERTVRHYLWCTAGRSPDKAARRVISVASGPRRLALANLFSRVFIEPDLVDWSVEHLEWACQQFPGSYDLLWRYSTACRLTGLPGKAVRAARSLYERDPDNPRSMHLLGLSLIEDDAPEAFALLERASERIRSAEVLSSLAGCCRLVGRDSDARRLLWEIVERDPLAPEAWTDLHHLGESCEKLWPYVARYLDRGLGAEYEGFLVAVVNVARALKRTVPVSWRHIALRRLEYLDERPPSGNEQVELENAMYAWYIRRPTDSPVAAPVPATLRRTIAVRLRWPGCAWVPVETGAAT